MLPFATDQTITHDFDFVFFQQPLHKHRLCAQRMSESICDALAYVQQPTQADSITFIPKTKLVLTVYIYTMWQTVLARAELMPAGRVIRKLCTECSSSLFIQIKFLLQSGNFFLTF